MDTEASEVCVPICEYEVWDWGGGEVERICMCRSLMEWHACLGGRGRRPRSEREDGCVSAVAKPAVCVCVVLCEVAYQSTEAVMVGNGAPGGRTRLPGMIECGIGSVVLPESWA